MKDVGSSQLTEINASVCRTSREEQRSDKFDNSENVQNEPSVYFKPLQEMTLAPPGFYSNETAEGVDNITNLDKVKGIPGSLDYIETVREEFGMFGKEFQPCELAEMGARISTCGTAQQPGGSPSPSNAVIEQLCVDGCESRICEQAEDGSRTSICRNEETLGKSSGLVDTVRGQVHIGGSESCYAPEQDANRTSNREDHETLGESLSPGKNEDWTCRPLEGNGLPSCDITRPSEENISLTPATREQQTLCLESHTSQLSVLKNSSGLECGKSELLDHNVILSNSVVLQQASGSLILGDNAVEQLCQLNLQDGLANCNAEFSNYAGRGQFGHKLSPNEITGEQQDGVHCQSSPNEPMEEKIHAKVVENEPTSKEGAMEELCGINHASFDDLLTKPVQASINCTSYVGVENNSIFEQASETFGEGSHGTLLSEQSEQKEEAASEVAPPNAEDKLIAKSNSNVIESFLGDVAKTSLDEQLEESHHVVSKCADGIEQNRYAASDAKDCPNEQSGSPPREMNVKLRTVVLGSPAVGASKDSVQRQRRGKASSVAMKKKSSAGSPRVLRSRSRENRKAPEPSANMGSTSASVGGRRGRRKKEEMKGKPHDEFSRMRKHLRYLLHRIRYEQNLLDAYSSEGWRGQSLEKLRPEKELQRAKADINRSKLKIRDLFQRLNSVSAEGTFPDTLYDSEGLIDSEDIFCAKCGSKDLLTDNDIILCDGVCDRGFHQFCLEPPLRTEEIPPGDEGWLCPACDCRADCIDLLNDSQETKLAMEDSWEKVFPEAVAAVAGNEEDDLMGLPSDDSEDNDYNPEGIDDDAKVEGNELTSDESDSDESNSDESDSDESNFSSVSEDLGGICDGDQYLGLPSDDSEDDDYDPDAANVNQAVEHDSSSSDFTSASEDLGAALNDDETLGNDEPPVDLLEPDQVGGDSSTLLGRRHVERLDYKKLYDETYGNATSDSSDDEEWTDMVATKKTKGRAEKDVSVSSNHAALASADGSTSASTPRRRGRRKLSFQAANGSPAQLGRSSEKTSSSGKTIKRPPYNKLGETVTQRLYEAFKENQYPDRQMKEKLAKELGLTPQRVDKWFGNARWSLYHHPARVESSIARAASHSNTPPHNVARGGAVDASAGASTSVPGNGGLDLSKTAMNENGRRKSAPPKSRKRKNKQDDQPILQNSNIEISNEGTQTETLQTPDARRGRVQRRRKSVA